ncbi:FAD-dependent oxidoreductase [Aspergillus homomorphus CBS 101889]|uniref:FAD/NAD(P)-binding domain-containing protein n=1 Tax=Aspergillus homomorphus (strain CBS 101889) TaxID=1450537 RepID=A0A395HT02_ASPHC|nr:FAD/NAD(P)-binding domain-containing protein [Aspergillus homomorphus CBS 101889]RAL11072.1 FAD/NAD(P)-binding domain-containing protein [Aspergillus homomorphus CBS 101889]
MSGPILIIGAGLGGLALAQGLKKHNIPVQIYERDARQDFRAQGYRLRIGTEGILALRTTLSADLFALFESTCAANGLLSGGARLDALSGEPLAPQIGGGGATGGRPAQAHGPVEPYTVDRGVMREVLMTGLQEELHFGKRFTHYEVLDGSTDSGSSGVVVAFFEDGTSQQGALLVGADGLRSQVRGQLLSPSYPFLDTGMRIVYGKTYITPGFEERFARQAIGGMSLVTERGTDAPKTLLLEAIRFPPRPADVLRGIRLPRDYVYWVLLAHRDDVPLRDEETLALDEEGSARLSLELTAEWDPAVRVLFEKQDRTQASTLRMCSVRPDVPAWEANARVTLLGDAIHAMPPTGGMGVNTALRDAEDLVRRIAEVGGSDGVGVETVAQYEESLRQFARESVRLSWEGGRRRFDLRPIEACEEIVL